MTIAVLDENQVTTAVARYLEELGYEIIQKLNTGQHGTDVIAYNPTSQKKILIEVKGGTSSKPGTARYKKGFKPTQVWDRVAKGLYTVLKLYIENSHTNNVRIALACPDTAKFRKYLSPIIPLTNKLGIDILLASESVKVFVYK